MLLGMDCCICGRSVRGISFLPPVTLTFNLEHGIAPHIRHLQYPSLRCWRIQAAGLAMAVASKYKAIHTICLSAYRQPSPKILDLRWIYNRYGSSSISQLQAQRGRDKRPVPSMHDMQRIRGNLLLADPSK